jgi:hypothetical protein
MITIRTIVIALKVLLKVLKEAYILLNIKSVK